jgi:hypothetical protein
LISRLKGKFIAMENRWCFMASKISSCLVCWIWENNYLCECVQPRWF